MADIATFALADSLKTLEESWLDRHKGKYDALLDEIEGYWGSLPNVATASLHFELIGQAREILAFSRPASGGRRAIAFIESSAIRSRYAPIAGLKTLTKIRALYIPLSVPVLPPNPKTELSASVASKWLEAADVDTRKTVEGLLRQWPRRIDETYVVFSQPRPLSGGRAGYAFGFAGYIGKHPLQESGNRWKTTPIALKHHDPTYARARGGASTDLAMLRVAVIGCGSVGARIAEFLAMGGIRHLKIVDYDILEPDNVFRHPLGGLNQFSYKASAMKYHLEARLPGLEVDAITQQVEDWPPATSGDGLDAIIVAIGNPYIERRVLDRFHKMAPAGMPFVTTWLEPYGLGGHAVLTRAGGPGCLECLYQDADGTTRPDPKTSFVLPGQNVGKNLTGCAGAFTPYSASDAVQTAVMGARLILNALKDRDVLQYISWRGTDNEFVAAGFKTSPFYDTYNEDQSRQAAIEFSRVKCSICGGTS